MHPSSIMARLVRTPALLLAPVLSVSLTLAGGSRTFDISNFAVLADLELHGAALTVDGGLVAGPRQEIRIGPAVPILWDVVPLAGGGAYAVGGSPGTVLYVPPQGEGRSIADFGEAEITAALWRGEKLLVAVSPGGLVFEIDAEGHKREVAHLDSRYIWDLLVDDADTLWIAAGNPGALVRLKADSETSEMVLDLGVQHVRVLARHPRGGILFGTSGEGQIRWLDADSEESVIHDSDLDEITALAVGADGTIHAAVVAAPANGARAAGRDGAKVSATTAGRSTANGRSTNAAKKTKIRSRVIAVAVDGTVRELWRSADETVLTLLAHTDGTLWAGTSPGGAIHAIRPDGRSTQLAHLPGRSVTALRGGPDGKVWATTGGLGLLAVLDPAEAGDGQATGPVLAAGPGAVFGALQWWPREGDTDAIALSFRTGNTEHPDSTWSAWSKWNRKGHAPATTAVPGRYLQWRARLGRNRDGSIAELRRLQVAYLPQNVPPSVAAAQVLPSGLVLERLPVRAGQAESPPRGDAGGLAGSPAGSSLSPRVRTRRVFRHGLRTVTWTARDDDGDTLVARLWLRADGESDYVLFAEDIDDSFHVFHEATLPDGGFVFQVEVSDQPANTLERAAGSTRETARFVVDRTPPVVADLRHDLDENAGSLSFSVQDGTGAPQQVEVHLDGHTVFGALPLDGLADESIEAYRVRLPALTPGEHVATVRVTDTSGNVASARLRFTLRPEASR